MPAREAPWCALILAALAFCYAIGLDAPPAYDDAMLGVPIREMGQPGMVWQRFRDPRPLAPPGVMLPDYAYRPVTEASVALNAALTGPTVRGLRLGNLLIHAAAAFLVLLLARRLGPEAGIPSPAFPRWAALAFAVHPMGVQAVTYVYQRATSLEALLGFLTLYGYWTSRTGPKGWRYALALLSALLALGAKETAVTLPLALGILEWILRRPGESRKAVLARWVPFALLPAVLLVQVLRVPRLAGGSGWLTGSPYGPLGYLAVQMPVLADYLRLAALPFPLAFYFDRILGPADLGLLLGCAALLIMLSAWVLLGRGARLPRLAVALFLSPLMLESTIFPIKDVAWNYRCYPGLLGGSLLFAWILARLGRRAFALGGLALALLASLALHENRTWTDRAQLLRRDVRHAWHLELAWGNRGWERLGAERPVHAERLFRRALRSPWRTPKTMLGLAGALAAQERRGEARDAFDQALSAFPGDPGVLWMALRYALDAKDAPRIEALAAQAGALPFATPACAAWLARRSAAAGRTEEARRILDAHLAQFPSHPLLQEVAREMGPVTPP